MVKFDSSASFKIVPCLVNISGYRHEKVSEAKLAQGKRRKEVKFYCVIDFEGTWGKENPEDYIHEITEFPVILVDARYIGSGKCIINFSIFVAMQSGMGRSIFNLHCSKDAWKPNPQIPVSTLWNDCLKDANYTGLFEQKIPTLQCKNPPSLVGCRMDVIFPQSSFRGFWWTEYCPDPFQQLLIKAKISLLSPNPSMVLAGNMF